MSHTSVDSSRPTPPTPHDERVPYVGPRAIEADDLFFGREEETEALVDKLLPGGITLLHAPSGAGKTSLIQASLMPSLHELGFQVCANVDTPFSALRVNLPPPDDVEVANRYVFSLVISLVGHLVERHEAARMTFDRALTLFAGGEQQRQLVVIDQLEEALTLDPNDRQGQREFFKQLGTALRRDRRWALLAIREDYLGGLDRYRQFFPNELRTTFRLDFLDEDAALRAVQLPAEQFGVTFTDEAAHQLVSDLRRVRAISATPPTRVEREDPPTSGPAKGGTAESTITKTTVPASAAAHADPIVEDATVYPYVEPVLLQVVCSSLWRILKEERKAAFTAIEASDLDEVRPYSRSLSNYYRAALREAAGDDVDVERAIRAWIERELLTSQKTRRPTRSLPPIPNARDVVGKLQRHYLVRDDPRPGGVFFELSHDMLVQTIVDDNSAWRRSNLRPWQIMAEEWSLSRDSGFLLVGPAFHVACEEARRTALSPAESDYLAASERADADRRRRRRRTSLLMILLIVALVGAGSQWYRARVAAEDARKAAGEAASRAYAAKAADFVTDDPLRAIALADRGLDSAPTAEAEDALRQAMSQNVPTAVLAHAGDVVSTAFSPSGDRLVTSSSDQTVRIWDSATGRQLDLRRFEGGAQDARFSPDGKSVLVLTNRGALTVFQPDKPGGVKELAGDVSSPITFNADGSRVAVTDTDYAVRILDPVNGTPVLRPLTGNADAINAIEFSSDGQLVATAGQDGTARVWGVATGALVAAFPGHSSGVTQVAFRADGGAIATGDGTGTARLWALRDDHSAAPPVVTLQPQQNSSARVAFDRAGQLLAYGDRSPRLFDGTTGTPIREFTGHRDWVIDARFTADGQKLVTASRDGTARVWDVASGQQLAVLQSTGGNVYGAAVTPTGNTVAVTSATTVGLYRLDERLNERLLRTATPGSMNDALFLPGTTAVAAAGQDGRVTIWDTTSSAIIATLTGPTARIQAIDVDTSGTYMAAATNDGTVWVWDWRKGALVAHRNVKGTASDVHFDPAGKKLVIAGGSVTLWPWQSPEQPQVLSHFPDDATAAAFSPDGQYIAVGHGTVVELWRPTGTKPERTILGHTDAIRSVAFSPNGGRLLVSASLDGTARIWRTDNDRSVITLEGHRGAMQSATFNDQGDRVVTAEQDGTIGVWDTATGRQLALIPRHTDTVNAAQLSSGEHPRIVSASADTTVRIDTCDTCEPVAQLRRRAQKLIAADGRTVPPHTTVGECFPTFSPHQQPVDCPSPHRDEVFAMLTHPAPADATLPADLNQWAHDRCTGQPYTEYRGEAYSDSAAYDAWWYVPSSLEWDLGQRGVVCVLTPRDLLNRTQSAKASR
jgi:WD40 repeat protein